MPPGDGLNASEAVCRQRRDKHRERCRKTRQRISPQRVSVPAAGSASKSEDRSRNKKTNGLNTNKVTTEAMVLTVESEKSNNKKLCHKAKRTKTSSKSVQFDLQRNDIMVLSDRTGHETADTEDADCPCPAETDDLRPYASSSIAKKLAKYDKSLGNNERVQTQNASPKSKKFKIKGSHAESIEMVNAKHRFSSGEADEQVEQSNEQNCQIADVELDSRVSNRLDGPSLSHNAFLALSETAEIRDNVFVESESDLSVCGEISRDITLLDTVIERSQIAKPGKKNSKPMNAKKHEEHLRNSKNAGSNDCIDKDERIASATSSSVEERMLTKSNSEADGKSKKFKIKKAKERGMKLDTNATTADEACCRIMSDSHMIEADEKRVRVEPKEKQKLHKAFENQEEVTICPKGMTENSSPANAACVFEGDASNTRFAVDSCSNFAITNDTKNLDCSTGDAYPQHPSRKPVFKKAASSRLVTTVCYPLSSKTDLNVCIPKEDGNCSVQVNGCDNRQESSLASSSDIAQKKRPIFQTSRKTLGVRNAPNVTD
jgi:hypothetical protein